ncbi:MAG TPA: hypothetical protein G4O10_04045 [Dehalococcoidia bacterium]|nr:hypothetical protein [Dehalococcoidia bacterium]
MSSFRKALLLTAIPIVVLSLISVGFWLADSNPPAEQVGFGVPGLLIVAIIAAIMCQIRGMPQTAKGIWVGFGIGLVGFVGTWIASY